MSCKIIRIIKIKSQQAPSRNRNSTQRCFVKKEGQPQQKRLETLEAENLLLLCSKNVPSMFHGCHPNRERWNYVHSKDSDSYREAQTSRNFLLNHLSSPHFSLDCLAKHTWCWFQASHFGFTEQVWGSEMFPISVHRGDHRESSSCLFNQHLGNLGFVATLQYY